ncbi:hypothetical protein [Streptomyces hydrogenans]|uniref:hypothetical protein n=1 Tax=Streptomyces hydrogenans TaxID=1873719 RepID=UPI0035DA3A08
MEKDLASVSHPQGLGGARQAAFAPETRELVVEVELPGQAVVPSVTPYWFMAKALYRDLVAQPALWAIDHERTH